MKLEMNGIFFNPGALNETKHCQVRSFQISRLKINGIVINPYIKSKYQTSIIWYTPLSEVNQANLAWSV